MTHYEYDPMGRITKVDHKKIDGKTMAAYTTQYDAGGRTLVEGNSYARTPYTKSYTYGGPQEEVPEEVVTRARRAYVSPFLQGTVTAKDLSEKFRIESGRETLLGDAPF